MVEKEGSLRKVLLDEQHEFSKKLSLNSQSSVQDSESADKTHLKVESAPGWGAARPSDLPGRHPLEIQPAARGAGVKIFRNHETFPWNGGVTYQTKTRKSSLDLEPPLVALSGPFL